MIFPLVLFLVHILAIRFPIVVARNCQGYGEQHAKYDPKLPPPLSADLPISETPSVVFASTGAGDLRVALAEPIGDGE